MAITIIALLTHDQNNSICRGRLEAHYNQAVVSAQSSELPCEGEIEFQMSIGTKGPSGHSTTRQTGRIVPKTLQTVIGQVKVNQEGCAELALLSAKGIETLCYLNFFK